MPRKSKMYVTMKPRKGPLPKVPACKTEASWLKMAQRVATNERRKMSKYPKETKR